MSGCLSVSPLISGGGGGTAAGGGCGGDAAAAAAAWARFSGAVRRSRTGRPGWIESWKSWGEVPTKTHLEGPEK